MAKILVTQDMATNWLDNNGHNRKVSKSNVNKIAKAMSKKMGIQWRRGNHRR